MSGTGPCRMFLFRHGQAQMPNEQGQVWNYSEAALTDAGRHRAGELAAALAGVHLDAVYASDLHRTRQTAEAIANPHSLPVIPDERLRELNIGDFEGMTLARLGQLDGRFLPWLQVYFEGRHAGLGFHVPADLSWPGGESVGATLGRVLPAFLEMARRSQGRTIAVCTHAYVLQALLCHIVGIEVAKYWSFAAPPASFTMVDVGTDGRGVLRALNGELNLPALVGGRLPLRRDDDCRLAAHSTVPDSESDDLRSTCRVFLARHGQSMVVEDGEPVYSHHPVGLTVEGRRQARVLASMLAPVRLDAVYTSDLNRARETADPVAAVQRLTPVVVPELREISLGDFEGMTLARVHAEQERFIPWLEVAFNLRFPSEEFHHPADLVFPGGESVASVYKRVLEPFLRIVRAHLGGTIAVVGHGWVLQPLLCHVLGAPTANYYRFQLSYASPTLVEVDADGRGVLEALNSGAYMASAGPAAGEAEARESTPRIGRAGESVLPGTRGGTT